MNSCDRKGSSERGLGVAVFDFAPTGDLSGGGLGTITGAGRVGTCKVRPLGSADNSVIVVCAGIGAVVSAGRGGKEWCGWCELAHEREDRWE